MWTAKSQREIVFETVCLIRGPKIIFNQRPLVHGNKAPKVVDRNVPEGDEGESEEEAEASPKVCHLQMKVISP